MGGGGEGAPNERETREDVSEQVVSTPLNRWSSECNLKQSEKAIYAEYSKKQIFGTVRNGISG